MIGFKHIADRSIFRSAIRAEACPGKCGGFMAVYPELRFFDSRAEVSICLRRRSDNAWLDIQRVES